MPFKKDGKQKGIFVGNRPETAALAKDPEILAAAGLMLAKAFPERVGKLSNIPLPRLYPLQWDIYTQRKRFNVLNIGRRWGKTYFGIYLTLETITKGGMVGWFAPTYKFAVEVWRTLDETLGDAIKKRDAKEMRAELHGGGVVEVWSMENEDAGRSRKYHRVIVDEAAAASKLKVAWENAILPTLADFQGDAWFCSTPQGMNYFYDLAQQAQQPDKQDLWSYWSYPTITNPYLPEGEVELARQTLPEMAFRQEYEALFIQNEGAVFRNLDTCLDAPVTNPASHRGHKIVAGVDWGRQHDFTAISLYCCTCGREVILDRFNKIGWEFQRERLLSLCYQWGVHLAYVERNSMGGPLLERLGVEAQHGLKVAGFTATNQSKARLIQDLALSLERNQSHWLSDEAGRFELMSYECTTSVHGNVQYSAPDGRHDDTVIARALAWSRARLMMPVKLSVTEQIERDLPDTWKSKYLASLPPDAYDRYSAARQDTFNELTKAVTIRNRPEIDATGEATGSISDAY